MKTRTIDVIQLSDGSTMTLSKALDAGRVYVGSSYAGRGVEPTYVAREMDGDRYWAISKTLFDRRREAESRERRGY